ncbi:MAG: ribosome assembly cofactor RimP [Bacteroidota bacterium]
MQRLETVEEDIRNRIASLNPEAFVIEIKLHRGKHSVLSILVDTDEGITIDACARISRHLNSYFEEEDPLDFPFNLEVSSPGVGRPIKVHRQYLKNVGRKLKVVLQSGDVVKGKLIHADDAQIQLEPPPKKKKKKSKAATDNATSTDDENKITIDFESIKEAKVEISFD